MFSNDDRFGDQIVVRVANDFDFGKFANGKLAAHVNPSVNVRRIGFAATDQIIFDFRF